MHLDRKRVSSRIRSLNCLLGSTEIDAVMLPVAWNNNCIYTNSFYVLQSDWILLCAWKRHVVPIGL